ncbi:hypothetical protein [Natronoglycomyces albus]|uniref:Uncharacterized protein n=1 Tax=Natronoglycomyces albus TaxID=2811108 RepID=A0A895XK10_9ACTN|nr:hypothetical protein [Natronoglycomyces albus]QSB06091.1 hypothetical protein JQS30_04005 [Natronoglycomyces albus]
MTKWILRLWETMISRAVARLGLYPAEDDTAESSPSDVEGQEAGLDPKRAAIEAFFLGTSCGPTGFENNVLADGHDGRGQRPPVLGESTNEAARPIISTDQEMEPRPGGSVDHDLIDRVINRVIRAQSLPDRPARESPPGHIDEADASPSGIARSWPVCEPGYPPIQDARIRRQGDTEERPESISSVVRHRACPFATVARRRRGLRGTALPFVL